ncbi:MAG: hypothetical protein IT581_18395 [Verrucomicrobiales bacterium]|nr:hypothetical protein [Verrucomicrobiales bacterium]
MKTRRTQLTVWLAASVLGVLASGCGAKTVGSAERGVEPATNILVTAAGTSNDLAPAVASSAAPEAETPTVRRSEKSNVVLRPEVDEVVRLVESGAGEEVTRAYVEASAVAYDLSLDEVIYLRDVGIPDSVIAGMMRRGGELRSQAADAASLQTNLVAAVNQLKDAIDDGPTNGAAAAAATQQVPAANSTADAAAMAPPAPPAGAPSEPVAVQAPAPPTDAPEDVQRFYGDLSPYGTWYQTPSGWVWRPSVVGVDPYWMPYRHGGRWVWSDWGWYWCSDYSWGWAPFHYGRWTTYPGLGWCWIPDRVWGPSWVTWRHHGSYIGWAPLPPGCGWRSGFGLTWHGEGVSLSFGFGLAPHCYTFVSGPNFCHRNLHHHVVRDHEVTTVYNNSTVINNVVNGNNNTIVNNGVGYNTVAGQVRGEIPKARVEALPDHADKSLRADRMERAKDGFVVYRPTAVESVGGRPAALRSEVRPASATASSSGIVPSRSIRPSAGSGGRNGELAVGAGKGIESRGASAYSGAERPSAPGASPSTARVPSARSSAGYSSKPVESRPGQAGVVAGSSANTPAVGGDARRQTLPVPLADPSRNLPSRTPNTAPSRSVSPSKPTYESRGSAPLAAPTAPNAPAVPRSLQQSPSSNVRPPASQVTPAPSLSRPSPGATYNSGGVGSRAMPSSAPKVDYQRPAYSQPSPSVSSPRPSYSSPSPAGASPRPSYSSPSPAPSSPAPSSSSQNSGRGGSGGSRQQQN